jgi:hypothetical protein
MSRFDDPKKMVPDDDAGYLAPEFLDRFDFEGELDEDDLAAHDIEETAIVADYNNWINLDQLQRDVIDGSATTYLPAQVIRIKAKRSRTLPTGQVILEYDLEVQEVAEAKSYEIRVQER